MITSPSYRASQRSCTWSSAKLLSGHRRTSSGASALHKGGEGEWRRAKNVSTRTWSLQLAVTKPKPGITPVGVIEVSMETHLVISDQHITARTFPPLMLRMVPV